MPGTANGAPKSELQAEGSLAGFETIEALLEVRVVCLAVGPSQLLWSCARDQKSSVFVRTCSLLSKRVCAVRVRNSCDLANGLTLTFDNRTTSQRTSSWRSSGYCTAQTVGLPYRSSPCTRTSLQLLLRLTLTCKDTNLEPGRNRTGSRATLKLV